jgi:hypothetical protein
MGLENQVLCERWVENPYYQLELHHWMIKVDDLVEWISTRKSSAA